MELLSKSKLSKKIGFTVLIQGVQTKNKEIVETLISSHQDDEGSVDIVKLSERHQSQSESQDWIYNPNVGSRHCLVIVKIEFYKFHPISINVSDKNWQVAFLNIHVSRCKMFDMYHASLELKSI